MAQLFFFAYGQTTTIQLIDFTDFQGQLLPMNIAGVGVTGGPSILSAYFDQEELAYPNTTLIISGGNAFGASLQLSSFFEDIPAVLAMNLMGVDVDTLGHHNFDYGLQRVQMLLTNYSQVQYVSANLASVSSNLPMVKPYKIFTLDGVKVAVIGLTNPEAPSLVCVSCFGNMTVNFFYFFSFLQFEINEL